MGHLSLLFMAVLPLPAAAAPWTQVWHSVPELVSILETVPEGRAVLRAAEAKDPHFAERIKTGTASFTESTFSRTFSLVDGRQTIHLHHEITLNRELTLADAVVDLAHELVHFTEKGMLDPYKPGFELKHFIRNGIEGPGGELAALTVECRVAWALEEKFEKFPNHRLCERYRKAAGEFARESARVDYYSLGTWFGRRGGELHAILPEISDHASVFTSSYAGKPYPVALAEEFGVTRQAACANNRRKYRLIAAQSGPGRRIASSELRTESQKLRDYERRYCVGVEAPSVDVSTRD